MFELILEHRAIAQHIASVLLGLAMFRFGGAPERWVAAVFLGLFTLPVVFFELAAGYALFFAAGGAYYASVDVIAAVLFMVIALQANRNYTLWIAGLQIVAASSHAVRFMVDVVTTMAHAMMTIGPGYFQLGIMAAGLICHVRRKNRHGEYRDWRVALSWPFQNKAAHDILKGQL